VTSQWYLRTPRFVRWFAFTVIRNSAIFLSEEQLEFSLEVFRASRSRLQLVCVDYENERRFLHLSDIWC